MPLNVGRESSPRLDETDDRAAARLGDGSGAASPSREQRGERPWSAAAGEMPGSFRAARTSSEAVAPQSPTQATSEADDPALSAPTIPRTYSFSAVPDATRPLAKQTLTQLFGLSEEDNREIFGEGGAHELQLITTFLANGMPEEDNLAKNNVAFLNAYSPQAWVMLNNLRDPDLAPKLRMRQVVKYQAQKAGLSGGPPLMVRGSLVSLEAKAFFRENDLKHKDVLSPTQFEKFMKTTPNGGSTRTILKDYGLKAVGARVIHKGGVPLGTSDADIAKRNIVLTTAPLDPEEAPR
jgi:hypothetical protein